MDPILEVLNIINEKGYEAYLIGGYPRDLYMNKQTIDYDITTNATPKEIKDIFKENVKSDNYGCVDVYYKNKKFEITTYRRDIKYNVNRKPVIEYIDNLTEDLSRRDFTMNTICIDAEGNILDLLEGRKDIDSKIIRVVGNVDKKLQEDPLRILRAIRFATTLNFMLDKKLEEGIKKYGYKIEELSFNRKRQELDKIFLSSNMDYGLKLIKKLNLESYLGINVSNLKQTTYVIGVWAQIDNDKYPFTKTEKDTIKKVQTLLKKDILNNYNLYQNGLYISSIAGEIKDIKNDIIIKKYEDLCIKSKDEIAITPKEICQILNCEPSSLLKTIITDLELKILNGKITNDKNTIVKYLKETYL